MGRVTIGDVAAHAGVSVSTVSKVINDRYGVAETTSARIRTVIDELGYHASLAGQSLRSRRTNVIGVLVRDIEPFSAELLKGVAEGIQGTGFELVVFSGCGQQPDQAGWERRYLARVSGTLADGVILVTPGSVDAAAGSPVVAVDHNVRSSALPTVDSENFLGAVSAVEYLIGLGHRRIGFVAGRADLESARLREAAYRHALEQAGIAFDPLLVQEGGFQPETAAKRRTGCWHSRCDRRRSSRPTTGWRSRSCPRRPPAGSRSRAICRSSASTTSRSRHLPRPRSRPSSSRSGRWAWRQSAF